MSGHSKWSTIKRKKAANDARRGSLFTRLAREIAIAAREGGGDPETNFSLRLAVDKARASNMPKENIERAIRRGTGEDKDGAAFEQVMYEGFAPHGVALMIEVVTDNRNRAVAWQFRRAAYFALPVAGLDPDAVFELAVDAGADDVLTGDDDVEIFAPVEAFKAISDRLAAQGLKPDEAVLRMIPTSTLELAPEQALQVMKLIDSLEELDDVTQVYSNLKITDAALALLEAA